MHTLALQLAPIVAAEKSKVPFYIAGGVLVAWALTVSLALGLRRPRFPGGPEGERAVIAISAVLVLAAVVTAVLTSGGSSTAGAAGSPANAQATSTTSAPNPAAPSSSSTESTPAAAAASGSASPAPASSSTSPAPASSASSAPATSTAAPAPAKGGAASSVMLSADPTGLLSFNTKTLSATAGTVTITFRNTAQLEHNVAVAQGSTVLGATPTFTGGNRTLTLSLKPGSYTFYCTVPGHRQGGMEGTLKVS